MIKVRAKSIGQINVKGLAQPTLKVKSSKNAVIKVESRQRLTAIKLMDKVNKNVLVNVAPVTFFGQSGNPVVSTTISTFDSDITQIDYYYYGYLYTNGTHKIIRVEKQNVVNQEKSVNQNDYATDWTNRINLIYN